MHPIVMMLRYGRSVWGQDGMPQGLECEVVVGLREPSLKAWCSWTVGGKVQRRWGFWLFTYPCLKGETWGTRDFVVGKGVRFALRMPTFTAMKLR